MLSSSAQSMILHRSSGLLAVVCEDATVRMVDIETRRIVRELSCGQARILDIVGIHEYLTIRPANSLQAFSPDSRWIVLTSLDSIIRTFDIPTGGLIDAFRTPSIATSIAFSPTNDFLATAHVDSVGVFLWANRAQFAEVTLRTVSEKDITEVSMPSMQGDVEDDGISLSSSSIAPWLMPLPSALEALTGLVIEDKPVDVFSTPPQLDGDLVTLTLLPRSRWQTLLNLEVIQVRVTASCLCSRPN